MSRNFVFCNNCGETGHAFHQCKKPITSMGTIVIKYDENIQEYKYLLICRKDTLGFVDFMRGKYPLYNRDYIENIIAEMTIDERERLLNDDFNKLWSDLWGEHIGIQYRGEERVSRDKLAALRSGVVVKKDMYTLEDILENIKHKGWEEPEWGFPKGRRNYQEKNIQCALREFQEETGYNSNSLLLVQNLEPFEEIFTGSNHKSYKHLYYLAMLLDSGNKISEFQKTEVSKIEWMTCKEAMEKIRPYNIEKKDILSRVDNLLNNYQISA